MSSWSSGNDFCTIGCKMQFQFPISYPDHNVNPYSYPQSQSSIHITHPHRHPQYPITIPNTNAQSKSQIPINSPNSQYPIPIPNPSPQSPILTLFHAGSDKTYSTPSLFPCWIFVFLKLFQHLQYY